MNSSLGVIEPFRLAPAETPYWSEPRGAYLSIPPGVPERYLLALPALAVYTARTLRREHPDGRTDGGGRWYPSAEERRPCCARVRAPSRAWRWPLMTHCRSAAHVAALAGVEPRILRGLLAWIVRYHTATGSAPWLCVSCGAYWACEHVPAPPDGSAADPALVAVPPERADMRLHGV